MTDDGNERIDGGHELTDALETEGTVCPFCAVGCRLDRDGDRIRGRRGAANPNGRLCEKGLRALDPIGDDGRITTPLVREDGDLVAATWETAIDRTVDAFEGIYARDGADALAFLGAPRCTNEENYLLQKLARTLGTNNVDNRARLCHAETARTLADRLGWPATTNRLADLRGADLFLVVGANPAERQPIAFDSYVRPAVDDGATLVHVDPHSNETTRKADVHLAPRPGTDALVVTLLDRLIGERDGRESGAVDAEFIANRTRGDERYRAWLETVDVAPGARRAGVETETLETVASRLATAEGVAVLTGTGADDAATADALVNLLARTDNLGRPDCGFFLLRGLTNEQGATDAGCVPDRLPGHRPVSDADARDAVAAEWGVEPPSAPGMDEHALLAAFGSDVAGALVVGENPAISKRDADWLERKLDALDVLVVSELRHSETTAHADVVFPAAAGVETAGTVTNLDRQVQRLRPLADPPDEARSDFELLRTLGRRLVDEGFDYAGPRAAFAEMTRIAPAYEGLSYDDLGERSRRWPVDDTDGAADDDTSRPAADDAGGAATDDGVLYRESFATPDGRVALKPVDLPDAANSDATSGLQLVVGDRAGRFGGDDAVRVEDSVAIHPEDATALGLADGERVIVANDAASVETTADVRASVRPGTVYVHASVGDPLVRGGEPVVTIRPVGETASPE